MLFSLSCSDRHVCRRGVEGKCLGVWISSLGPARVSAAGVYRSVGFRLQVEGFRVMACKGPGMIQGLEP